MDNGSTDNFVIDPSDGRVERTFPDPDGGLRLALEFNGNYLVDASEELLNFLDPADGSVVKSFSIAELLGQAGSIRGIGYIGDLAFLSDQISDTIFVFRDASAVTGASSQTSAPSPAGGPESEAGVSGAVAESGVQRPSREPAR